MRLQDDETMLDREWLIECVCLRPLPRKLGCRSRTQSMIACRTAFSKSYCAGP